MTNALQALLEKAEPDAWLYISAMPDGSLMLGASSERLVIGQGVPPNTQEAALLTIDTVCAALPASAAVEPVDAESLARKFHETYERLAPSFGYETREETRNFDPTSTNGRLMIAVCAAIQRAESAQPKEADKVCECTMRQKLVGDGCQYCNPRYDEDDDTSNLMGG